MKTRYCKWNWTGDEDYYQDPHLDWKKDHDEIIISSHHLKYRPYCAICGKKIKLVKEEV